MAPSPEHDKEPKAPDKSHSQVSDNSLSDISVPVLGTRHNSEPSGATGAHTDTEEGGQLERLDEGQLRTLLDEAVTYRRPKDREGKSLLFKELLQEVEQDCEVEWASQCSRRGRRTGGSSCSSSSGGGGGGRRGLARPPLQHSGSLQDLAEGGAGGGAAPLRHHATRHNNRHNKALPRQVSARSQQGGSLPANVDQHNFGVVEGSVSFLEDVRSGGGVSKSSGGGDYIATVRCVNPPPLGERPTDYMLLELGPLGHHRAASPPPTRYYTTEDLHIRSSNPSNSCVNFTSRATLEIGSPASRETEQPLPVASAVTPPAPCDSPPPTASSCPLQLAGTYCSVKSVVGEDAAAAMPQGTVSSSSTSGNSSSGMAVTNVTTVLSHPITTASAASSHLSFLNIASCNMVPRLAYQTPKHDTADFKKSLDENGNSVQTVNATITGPHIKKSKRKKCKNETETLSNEIDGYRGREDLDDILKFIESTAADNAKNNKSHSKSNTTGINGKISSAREGKTRDDNTHDKTTKKRSTERRTKDGKMDKLKKANSMEELSTSKLDDLTSGGSSKETLSLRKSKKQSTFDQTDLTDTKRSDRRSWGNDGSDSYYCHESTISNDGDDSFSTNASNCSSSHSSVTGQTVKPKKSKTSPRLSETEHVVLPLEAPTEASDFQTVTNKKKIRKRHSPCDETRGRSNNAYLHNNYSSKNNGRFNASFTLHDRDSIYKRMGGRAGSAERRHPSVSSPPSDKSNDSNDDLDSVHSLPAEASGERLQASYADMARAAVASLPPPPNRPPPSASPPPPTKHRNFPDLIESCNYYSNERSLQDKYLDVSTENTKNLLLKESTPVDSPRNKITKSNIVDAGTQVETSSPPHPIYNHEQYPALEPRLQRDKNNSKNINNNKIEIKVNNSPITKSSNNNSSSQMKTTITPDKKQQLVKSNQDDNCIMSHQDHDISSDHYVQQYVENSTTDMYRNSDNPIKLTFLSKMDNFISSKPPDVVLPLADMTDNRPPVIILNEEIKRSSDNVHNNIDGITFGFDINEQLLNGETVEDVKENNNNDAAEDEEEQSTKVEETEPASLIIYNSSEFPAINERPPQREHADKQGRKWSRGGGGATAEQHGDKEEHLQLGHTRALRYLAPTPGPKDTLNLERIVHYVGMAWEDTIKSPDGNVRYYSEQQ